MWKSPKVSFWPATQARSRGIGLSLTGALAAVAASSAAVAITSSDFTYRASRDAFLTVSPHDLHPTDRNSASNFEVSLFPARLTTEISGPACFGTEINLPQGVRITSLTTYYSSAATSDVAVYLTRDRLAGEGWTFLASQGPINNSGSLRTATSAVSADVGTVANDKYSYGFAVCLGAGDSFQGSRIAYRYKTAGE